MPGLASGATAVVVTQGATTANVYFGLSPGGSIAGTVVQDSNGKAIQGVIVNPNTVHLMSFICFPTTIHLVRDRFRGLNG
jgi:hypothetical protein